MNHLPCCITSNVLLLGNQKPISFPEVFLSDFSVFSLGWHQSSCRFRQFITCVYSRNGKQMGVLASYDKVISRICIFYRREKAKRTFMGMALRMWHIQHFQG
eukprot:TRINITY_DN6600_c0_g1_i1.p1 TRINITY_DN6600_c0_g1~~TRINITY_DN6600_c0_g1_i1.p1  ORF type:complete len:102 (+),score=5.16 TRINITY_DN6600_c0_g1_i1:61-366(+)